MSIFIVVEHDSQTVGSGLTSVIAAAQQIGDDITALVIGHDCEHIAETTANMGGIKKVRLLEDQSLANGLAENVAPVIVSETQSASHVLMAAGSAAREWIPRAAALADVQAITDVIAIESSDTFVRPIYAGNALATVKSHDAIKYLTIRTTAFEGVESANQAEIEKISVGEEKNLSTFIEAQISKQERPDLTAAKIVVSGGRGVGSADNFKLIEKLADLLGAAVGASRAAVDAGYVPNDYQVGQTGKIVAPNLYIAVGISGAIQHIAGMKDSKCIVAINKDADAPIFEIADYGLVGDLFEILPELESHLNN